MSYDLWTARAGDLVGLLDYADGTREIYDCALILSKPVVNAHNSWRGHVLWAKEGRVSHVDFGENPIEWWVLLAGKEEDKR